VKAEDRTMDEVELMGRLYDLDAALSARQRTAIDVAELREVWDAHRRHLGPAELAGHGHWAEDMLQTIAQRHGIHGLVRPQAAPANSPRR
jgi:hypothetical protein